MLNNILPWILDVYNSDGRDLLDAITDLIDLNGQIADVLSNAVKDAQKDPNDTTKPSGSYLIYNNYLWNAILMILNRFTGNIIISIVELIGQALAQLLNEVDGEIKLITKSFDVSSVTSRNGGYEIISMLFYNLFFLNIIFTFHIFLDINDIVYNTYKAFGEITNYLKSVYNSVLMIENLIPAIALLPSD